jgi:hypothetical protein
MKACGTHSSSEMNQATMIIWKENINSSVIKTLENDILDNTRSIFSMLAL